MSLTPFPGQSKFLLREALGLDKLYGRRFTRGNGHGNRLRGVIDANLVKSLVEGVYKPLGCTYNLAQSVAAATGTSKNGLSYAVVTANRARFRGAIRFSQGCI